MSYEPKIDRIEDDGPRTPMTLRTAQEWAAMSAERDRLHEAIAWIARRFCERTHDPDLRLCPQTGELTAEWCSACYAQAALIPDGAKTPRLEAP